jgi:hypothetical protein
LLGLLLQMIEIQSIGERVHQTPPCMRSPTARNTGCTKALDIARKLQVGSTLPAGPGAACTAGLQYGQGGKWSTWPDEIRSSRKIPAAQDAAGIFIAGMFDQ